MMIRGQIKINGWDEVRGITSVQEDFGTIAEQIAADQAQAQGIQPGQEYMKNAEMQMEDDYNSIDGILNNGDRRETDPSGEDTRTKPEDQKAEAERESVMEKIREHEERIRSYAPDQVRFRKDALCPDRELC